MGKYVFLACFSAYVAWVLTLRVKELLHTRVVRKFSHNERRKWDKSSMARLTTRWLVLPLARSIQLLLLFWNTTLLTLLSKTVLTSTNFISREYTSVLIAWKKLSWNEKKKHLTCFAHSILRRMDFALSCFLWLYSIESYMPIVIFFIKSKAASHQCAQSFNGRRKLHSIFYTSAFHIVSAMPEMSALKCALLSWPEMKALWISDWRV